MSLSTNDQVIIGCTVGSAVLSTLGSLLISYHAIPKSRESPLNRLLLGLSLADISNSSRLILAPLIAYPRLAPSPGCTTDGFFTIFGLIGPYYNGALSFYYYAVIVRGMKDRVFSKWPERICHSVCFLYAFFVALAGVFLQTYNPNHDELGCYIAPYPVKCLEDETIPCERGELAPIHNYIAAVIPIVLVLILLAFFNVSIYKSVRRLEQKLKRYDFANGVSSAAAATVECLTSSTMGNLQQQQPQQNQQRQQRDTHQRSKKIAAQGFLYVFCFALSWLFVLIMFIMNTIDGHGVTDGKYFPIQVLMSLFYPIQGLLNAIVYIRPRVSMWRTPERSLFYSVWKASVSREKPPLHNNRQAKANNNIHKTNIMSPANLIESAPRVEKV